VAVPDPRVEKLTEMSKSAKKIPAIVEFYDIAGLVKGAATGEGLGNQFLTHIRDTSAVVQVLRCFPGDEIVHVENSVNPIRDMGIINTELSLKDLETLEKQTEPPSRYTEAALVKALEERGIGRPSTYASIMSTLEERGYVTKQGRTLFPTDTGEVVSGFLEEHFASYISDTFTAEMENELDEIASGSREYAKTLSDFYTPFQKELAEKDKLDKATSLGKADPKFTCPKCGSSMVIKLGRGGKFLSCSRYPDCDGALTLEGHEIKGDTPIGFHPETKEPIFVKSGRFGPYVQMGLTPEKKPKKKGKKKTTEETEPETPKPRMASIPKNIPLDQITLEQAVHLLALPRELGIYKDGQPIIANIGRFGPYIGAGGEFRSLKKPYDPYTITPEEATKLLDTPKALPRGVTASKELGIHPKTKKKITAYQDKKGIFIKRGLRKLYLEGIQSLDEATLESALSL
jgi:DNA topoisomerase-1